MGFDMLITRFSPDSDASSLTYLLYSEARLIHLEILSIDTIFHDTLG